MLLQPKCQPNILENKFSHPFLMSHAPNDPSGFSLVSVWHTSPTSTHIFGARYTWKNVGGSFTIITPSLSQITVSLWQRGLCNSMKLWARLCRATQDRWVMVESSDKTWSTGGGNANYSSIFATRTPWTAWKCKKIWHQKISPRLEGVQSASGEEQRAITNSSRKNEVVNYFTIL